MQKVKEALEDENNATLAMNNALVVQEALEDKNNTLNDAANAAPRSEQLKHQ